MIIKKYNHKLLSQKRSRRGNSLRRAAKFLHFLEQVDQFVFIFRRFIQNADYLL